MPLTKRYVAVQPSTKTSRILIRYSLKRPSIKRPQRFGSHVRLPQTPDPAARRDLDVFVEVVNTLIDGFE